MLKTAIEDMKKSEMLDSEMAGCWSSVGVETVEGEIVDAEPEESTEGLAVGMSVGVLIGTAVGFMDGDSVTGA